VVSAVSLPFERNGFVSEVQEAAVRFYFEEAHPVSGLSQEGAPGWGDTSAVGSTGMGMANIIVGVHRGFVTREQGVALHPRDWIADVSDTCEELLYRLVSSATSAGDDAHGLWH
jgi:hypothetical protein